MAQAGGESSKALRWSAYEDGTEATAELHWYEVHGLGKKEMKVKEVLE